MFCKKVKMQKEKIIQESNSITYILYTEKYIVNSLDLNNLKKTFICNPVIRINRSSSDSICTIS